MPPAEKKEYFTGDIKDRDLDFWIEMEYNAMFVGKHGVGKTHKIQDAFERNNLKWKYFSAATMDPWTDFVGVPKEVEGENGKSYLDFILPKEFADGSIEAIFFDEFNRAPKKVRNAVMELLQFKSINGRKFPNLKVIWTAINPSDDDDLDFDVEALDPAQEDRFHVQVEIPYKPDLGYFQKKYGMEVGKASVDWWDGLNDDFKKNISPRRLDYAIQVFHDIGNLRHVLPAKAPVAKLAAAIQHGPPEETIRKYMETNDVASARRWLAHMNNLDGVKKFIIEDDEIRSFALPLLGAELVTTFMSKNNAIKNEIIQNPQKYKSIIKDVASGSQHKRIKKQFQSIAKTLDEMGDEDHPLSNSVADVVIDSSKKIPQHFTKTEQKHIVNNFKFKDDYSVSDIEFKGNIESSIREAAVNSMAASNTWLKELLYNSISEFTVDSMTADEGIAVVRLCNFLAARHQSETLSQNYNKIPIIFNTAVHCIMQEKPDFSMDELFNYAPYLFFRYFSKENDKLPDNASELIVEAKPKKEWKKIIDTELEGLKI